jgi:hypothetical protein
MEDQNIAKSRPSGAARRRLAVPISLILSTGISLWFEPILTIHVVFGLAFAALVGILCR